MLKEFLRQTVSASPEVVRPPKADKQTPGGKKVLVSTGSLPFTFDLTLFSRNSATYLRKFG